MRIDTNLSALDAIATSQQATAHNVANVNTDEFRAQEVRLQSGPDGQGVSISEVRERSGSGGLVERQEVRRLEDGTTQQEAVMVELSNTELVKENTRMILDERAYEANIAAIRTQSEMAGTLIDELV